MTKYDFFANIKIIHHVERRPFSNKNSLFLKEGIIMKNLAAALSMVLVLFLVLPAALYANDVKLAEDNIAAGKYPLAISLLEKEVDANPKNAKAHFLLGTCYGMSFQMKKALASFDSAVKLNYKAYGHKIADIFREAGNIGMKQERFEDAKAAYLISFKYEPSLKLVVADDLYKKGYVLLQNRINEEDYYFILAQALNPALRSKIFSHYKEIGDSANDDLCALWYGKAAVFMDVPNAAIGRRVLDLAKKFAKQPERDQQTDAYKIVARLFLGETTVEAELPDTRIYQPGTEKFFELEAGEQTDHWIMFQADRKNSCKIGSTNESNYVVVNKDGSILPKGAPLGKQTRMQFKLKAITKSTIRLRVS